jgi:hypothetical protein
MLSVVLEAIIPFRFLSIWKSAYPGEGQPYIILPSGYTLRMLHEKLDLGPNELSGVIGPTWISVVKGNRYSSPCNGEYLFSWHYHPDGGSRFSIEDWLSFLVSEAQVSLLLTVTDISLYIKSWGGKWQQIKRAMAGENTTLGNKPNLRFLRFMRMMEKEFEESKWTFFNESLIASTLGIYYKKYTVK